MSDRRLEGLGGKAHVLALWAEWCTPCLAELSDLAGFARRQDGVGVLAILTGSRKALDWDQAQALMMKAGAPDLRLWIEPKGGDLLLKQLASTAEEPKGKLPCALLVDHRGAIRSRMFGVPAADPEAMNLMLGLFSRNTSGEVSKADMAKFAAAHPRSIWATKDADEFARAVKAGALSGV